MSRNLPWVFKGKDLPQQHKQRLLSLLQRLMTPAKLPPLKIEPEKFDVPNILAHLGSAHYKLKLIWYINGIFRVSSLKVKIEEITSLEKLYLGKSNTLTMLLSAIEQEGLKRSATTGCLL